MMSCFMSNSLSTVIGAFTDIWTSLIGLGQYISILHLLTVVPVGKAIKIIHNSGFDTDKQI